MSDFQVGVEDTRTLAEQLAVLNSSLDLYEILLTTEYVLQKYDDSSDSPVLEDEVPPEELDENEFDVASVDVTLNLNNDYFRVMRVDKGNKYKYSIMAQVNFDNIVHIKEYIGREITIDAFADRVVAIGTGKLKKEAESKYLLNGGKF